MLCHSCFEKLKTNMDMWFWALMAITEEDPVPDECVGMARQWRSMARISAKERGIRW